MNRAGGNRAALVALLLIIFGIPSAVLGYQFGLRPLLADHRIVDIDARAPEAGGFSPDLIRVEVGETVTLRFSADDVTHGIAIGPGLGIDLGQIDPGHTGEVTVTFDSPGIYTYYCNTWCSPDHWRMRGTIEVTGDASSPTDVAEVAYDPIIEELVAASVDIDAEPQQTIGISPDRSRGELNIEGVTVPAQLDDPAWRLRHTPAEGAQILSNVNPEIPDHVLTDVAALLWSESEPEPAAVELYAKNCAACHGESGTGDGPVAGSTTETPVSFADAAWMRRGDIWYAKIRRGGMGTDMPNFGTLFTVEETHALVDYLWFLAFETPTQ